MAKICALRGKFNDLLNAAAARNDNKILSIRSLSNPVYFDVKGNLSESGRDVYWEELDELIEHFENDKVKLRPMVTAKKLSNSRKEADRNEDLLHTTTYYSYNHSKNYHKHNKRENSRDSPHSSHFREDERNSFSRCITGCDQYYTSSNSRFTLPRIDGYYKDY